MRDIKDIRISQCYPLSWTSWSSVKDKMDYSKLVYVGKKRNRRRNCGKPIYFDEYIYWYPETLFGFRPKEFEQGEYFRSDKLLGDYLCMKTDQQKS